MFRNRRAKNSMPLPPGYIPVHMGHYRDPNKKLSLFKRIFWLTKILLIAFFKFFWLLCLLGAAGTGEHTANSARGLGGLRRSDFINSVEYFKYEEMR